MFKLCHIMLSSSHWIHFILQYFNVNILAELHAHVAKNKTEIILFYINIWHQESEQHVYARNSTKAFGKFSSRWWNKTEKCSLYDNVEQRPFMFLLFKYFASLAFLHIFKTLHTPSRKPCWCSKGNCVYLLWLEERKKNQRKSSETSIKSRRLSSDEFDDVFVLKWKTFLFLN